MSITMHSASAPVFIRMLANLLVWLDKAQAHAEARKFDANNYLGLRLAPDMLPFARQIQIASDGAKGCMARLAGVEAPKWDDNEATLADLRARVQKTIDYVKSFTAAQIDGSEGREITIPTRNGELQVQRRGLPEALRDAELLLPRHHRLRAVAPRRRRDRQERLPGRALTRPARRLGKRQTLPNSTLRCAV